MLTWQKNSVEESLSLQRPVRWVFWERGFRSKEALRERASQEEADHKSHRSKPSNTRWQPLCHLQGVISRLPCSSSTCHQKSCRTLNQGQPSKQGPGSTAGEQPCSTARIWGLSHKDRLQGKALLHLGHTHPRFPRSPEGRYSSLCLDHDNATQKSMLQPKP